MAQSTAATTNLHLRLPLKKIKGIGPKYGRSLEKMGLKTVQDVLYHFPRRYEDFPLPTKIAQLQAGENITVQGKIVDISSRQARWRPLTIQEALVVDGSGSLRVIWFNKPYLVRTLKPGTRVALAGKLGRDRQGLVLKDPEYDRLLSREPGAGSQEPGVRGQESGAGQQEVGRAINTRRLVPVYEETRGITSRFLRWLIYNLLRQTSDITEWLPELVFSSRFQMPALPEALWQIHFPKSRQQAYQAKRRFEFEQLFLLQLLVLQKRQSLASQQAPAITINQRQVQQFLKDLPFQGLTRAQETALTEILADLQQPRPMNRLLDGDVGTGKTVVAAIAAFGVIQAGFQVAFMAPTEVLAIQHFQTFRKFFQKTQIRLELLTASASTSQKKALRQKIRQGQVDLVIGTHALLHGVEFSRLGLVVVDEQHRFGVRQRHHLLHQQPTPDSKQQLNSTASFQAPSSPPAPRRAVKLQVPHYLTMTATPIPRTLALSLYGDLDISILDEFPQGQRDLRIYLVERSHRQQVYRFLRKKLEEGRQLFVIVPVIEKSESLPEVSAEEVFVQMQQVFFQFQVGLVHGRLKAQEKDTILKRFAQKELDVLVATTVVEVGLDVPGASLMLVKGAERFGLAQLHQLGGRIGRRGQKAYLFLEPAALTASAKRRLKALTRIRDGFQLAEFDLKMRGPGEFLGERQSGWPDVAFEALKDIRLVRQARQVAEKVLAVSPDLSHFPLLYQRFQEFNRQIHLE